MLRGLAGDVDVASHQLGLRAWVQPCGSRATLSEGQSSLSLLLAQLLEAEALVLEAQMVPGSQSQVSVPGLGLR